MNVPSLDALRASLYTAVVSDVLDQLGYNHQSPVVALPCQTSHSRLLVGRCRTTLWTDMAHTDPSPYELELQAVDRCQPDDVFVAAAGGSMRSAVWGELLTTAASRRGCVGAIVDGATRDVDKISATGFPVFARGRSVYDSRNRQRVVDIDVPVDIGGTVFRPGDLVLADADGVVVVPQEVEPRALSLAWEKANDEDQVRQAIKDGLSATEAYRRFGVL